MTVFDFFKKFIPGIEFNQDSVGNLYIYSVEHYPASDLKPLAECITEDYILISHKKAQRLFQIQIIADDDMLFYDSDVRRPYYRMRGKQVTREQAFEIIRRTDTFFSWELHLKNKDYLDSIHFNNWIILKNHYPAGYGWIHTDGTVGLNGITQTYPNAWEFVVEWLINLTEFPYLDLMIAVTSWNEMAPEFWEKMWEQDSSVDWDDVEYSYDKDFYSHIDIGIYVHENTIELLNPQNALRMYRKYEKLHEGQEREKYQTRYYQNRHIVQVDEAFLKKCFEKYGLDVEKTWDQCKYMVWNGKS
ncbi:MAG TPA: hypothetical protein IAB23_03365 [Candidatus Scybalocola faecavium]|nr:hypothetical protein [Candidatus Scybalocola faecavium]